MGKENFDWHVPIHRSEKMLGLKRVPNTECPHCEDRSLLLFSKRKTDWSETNVLDRFNPLKSTPKYSFLRWRCSECQFADSYRVPHDPVHRDGVEVYDSEHDGREQTRLNEW